MIREEYLQSGRLVHHWSDINMKILQVETGLVYEDAIDVVPCRYTYTETDEPIEATEE